MGRSQGARDKWRYEVESVRRKSCVVLFARALS